MITPKIKISILLLMSFLHAHSQNPSWIDFDARRQFFPQAMYLTGFASAKRDKTKSPEDQFRILTNYAKSELVEGINVSVSSQSLLQSDEKNSTLTQNFTQTTVSFANAELPGLKTETWEDKKEKQLYVFVTVRTSELCDYYQAKSKDKREKVLSILQEAEQYRKTDKNEGALRCFRDCLPLLTEMESGFSIVQALTKQSQQADLQELSTQVRRGLEELSHSTSSSPSETADILADAIAAKLKGKNLKLQALPFTYQDSKMAGEFSSSLLAALKQKLVDKGMAMVEPSYMNGLVNADALLTGVYWVENSQLRFIATVKSNDGAIIAGAEALLEKKWFTSNNKSWMPERFEESGSRMKIFTEGEIISGGLNLDLWTNKGAENLLYHENDTLKLYVRSNHDCYLRFVYYMADGSKVLLMNDYYIHSDQVNKVVQIPDNFVCSAPFGSELLVLNGQTTPFPKLATTKRDGYEFIDDNVKSIVMQTRGLKRINNEMLNGEKRLVVNTVK